jgi:hypothetical protein
VLVKSIESQKLIIAQLVRLACAQIAFTVTWEALQAPGWTDDQLRELQSAWQSIEFPRAMSDSFEMERDMMLEYFNQLRNSAPARKKVMDLMESPNAQEFLGQTPTRSFVLRYLHIPIWRAAWTDQDELRALDRWQAVIEADRVACTNSCKAAKPLFDALLTNIADGFFLLPEDRKKLGWYHRCRFLFSGDSFSIRSLTISKSLRAETEKNMVLTAIALKRYEFRKDNMPTELSALVPEFLSELPKDWMDGQPLRYKPNADGSFLLYSVGENGRDDGGDPRPETETTDKFTNIWKGRDAVWPIAVPPEKP